MSVKNNLKIFLLLITTFTINYNNSFAQVTTFYQGDHSFTPFAMTSSDNYIYVSNVAERTIERFNINNVNDHIIIANLTGVTCEGLKISGNSLYVSFTNGSSVYKINLNTTIFPIPSNEWTKIVTLSNRPKGLALSDNEFFVAEENKISKFNLSNTNFPIASTNIINFSVPYDITYFNGYLYVAATGVNRNIYRLNIYDSNPQLELLSSNATNSFGIDIHDNKVFFSHSDNTIKYITLNNSFPVTPNTLVNVNSPYGIAINSNKLFVAQRFENRISVVDFSTLSLEDSILKTPSILYNVIEKSISIKEALQGESIRIYNFSGQDLYNNIVTTEPLDVSHLSDGVYFISFKKSKQMLKFIKY